MATTLGVMSRDVVESVEGYAANRRVVSVAVSYTHLTLPTIYSV